MDPADDRDVLVNLEPIGLICGGDGSPLAETWIDLSSPNQVLYGLNGAGKTTVLEELRYALCGRRGGGQILARLPFGDDRQSEQMREELGRMLVGDEVKLTGELHQDFIDLQRQVLWPEFSGRDKVREYLLYADGLDWASFLDHLAASPYWLFTPVGTETARWTASPVAVFDPSSKWAQYLSELTDYYGDDYALPIPSDFDLYPLWWDTVPAGAPVGIVGALVARFTEREAWRPWWPFGHVVSDDASAHTRQHLALHPADRWSTNLDQIHRNGALAERVAAIQREAKRILPELLAEAPELDLELGDDAAWFAGRSCHWTARRFEGDGSIDLSRLSWAEQRWAHIAIGLALADDLKRTYLDAQAANDQLLEDLDFANPGDRLEIAKAIGRDRGLGGAAHAATTTWLLLDEPERGLHRTAEAQMSRGIETLTGSDVRAVLATHSPELLDHGVGDVSYVRRRSHDRPGAVLAMRDFDAVREDLGLNPSDMLRRRTRGIALAEGEHDLEILNGAIGTELRQLGVEVLALRGGSNLKHLVDSRFLYEFTDAVLFPVLDDLTLSPISELWNSVVVVARTKPASEAIAILEDALPKLLGKGTEFLHEFLAASIKNGTFERVQPLGIPQTDILECLLVNTLVPNSSTWEQVRESARRSNGGVAPSETKFKEYLGKAHKADLAPENLRSIAAENPTHRDLKALLAAMDARLSR